jgi:beta-phosphoglucomutase-like phosphatase (HAD superfamily)
MKNITESIYNSTLDNILETSDGFFSAGLNAKDIFRSFDHKIEFVILDNIKCLAGVVDARRNVTYYQLKSTYLGEKLNAVLMDLDGTTVDSEGFWIEIIRKVVVTILSEDSFSFNESDIPFISGHSVSEHLSYCINKYCNGNYDISLAINIYREIAAKKISNFILGNDEGISFVPADGLKEALMCFKRNQVKIGLVTSGNYYKAQSEIFSLFKQIGLGDPLEFYDAIITAGTPLKKNQYGTLGELSAKPHPWLYAETCQIGLGINPDDQHDVIGIEDSGAGVCALRLAGIPVIGLKNGNIIKSGYEFLCEYMAENLADAINFIGLHVTEWQPLLDSAEKR